MGQHSPLKNTKVHRSKPKGKQDILKYTATPKRAKGEADEARTWSRFVHGIGSKIAAGESNSYGTKALAQ
jgi:hypothetical protein